jgi:hypothetical protein
MTTLKLKILSLRNEGKSYRDIQKILNCSESTIWYYCSPGAKEKRAKENYKIRKNCRNKLKLSLGGKCKNCGYSKCLAALDFHHLDKNNKKFNISTMLITSFTKAKKESKKCILLCANCHREFHDGILVLPLGL